MEIFTKKRLYLLLLLFSFILFPNFIFRIGIFCVTPFLLLHYNSVIKRTYVFLSLFLLFSFAYIFSPYWLAFRTTIYSIFALGFLFFLGLIWSYFSSSHIKLSFNLSSLKYYFMLTVVLFIINFFPLNSDIAWRGDEDTHIHFILDLFTYMQNNLANNLNVIILFIFLLLISVLFYFFGKKAAREVNSYKKLILFVWLLFIPISSFLIFLPGSLNYGQMDTFSVWQILRFPYLSKWLNVFFIFPQIFADIKLYRAVPFLSAVFISWFSFYKFKEKTDDKLLSLFFSLAVATIPLLYFYSNILYLEMPVVFLILVCIFNLNLLIEENTEELIKSPIWYFLLVMSFFKETALIIILLIMGLRFFYQLRKNCRRGLKLKTLSSEINIYLLVLTPSLIYLFFRKFFFNYRSYGGEFSTLFNLSNYLIIIQALFNQFGFLFLFGILGFFSLLSKKDKFNSLSLLTIFIGIIWFFMIDSPLFLGYSRWNIFVLPIFIYVVYSFVVSSNRFFRIVILLVLFISNILFCPFKVDGTRLSNWGSPRIDTAEYLYPYEETIKWLSSGRDTHRLLVMGQYYRYAGLRYYFGKYNYYPEKIEYPFGLVRFDNNTEQYLLDLFFQKFQKKEIDEKMMAVDTILYHSVNNIDLDQNRTYGDNFRIVKKINNSLNSLYIFKKESSQSD